MIVKQTKKLDLASPGAEKLKNIDFYVIAHYLLEEQKEKLKESTSPNQLKAITNFFAGLKRNDYNLTGKEQLPRGAILIAFYEAMGIKAAEWPELRQKKAKFIDWLKTGAETAKKNRLRRISETIRIFAKRLAGYDFIGRIVEYRKREYVILSLKLDREIYGLKYLQAVCSYRDWPVSQPLLNRYWVVTLTGEVNKNDFLFVIPKRIIYPCKEISD